MSFRVVNYCSFGNKARSVEVDVNNPKPRIWMANFNRIDKLRQA